MQTRPTQLDHVIYNASTQSFEASVTVHAEGRAKRYACAIDAPITMTFEDAASGLATQALRRHSSENGMFSEIKRHVPTQRAGRAVVDVRHWLVHLVTLTSQRAA